MDSTETYNHTLYYGVFSTCSVRARLSYHFRGEAKDPNNEIIIKEMPIDIAQKEQLTEHYLCEVNSYGEVPTLVPVGGKPIPDSLDITLYFAKFYPSLMPEPYSAEIERLLKDLHQINAFSLTFAGNPESALESIRVLEERLQEDISEEYRAALQVKLKRVEEVRLTAVGEDEVGANVRRTKAMIAESEAILKDSKTGWFFGLSQPSAIDVYFLVLLVRLQDVKRDDLIPDFLKDWAESFMQSDGWREVMQGRRTLPPPMLAKFRASAA